MTLRPCTCEKEVTELLARGQRPEAFTPELRAHVSGCRSCGDLVLVTETFQRARAEGRDRRDSLLPERLVEAQLRRRNAAIERVNKPILGAQIFALAINLVLVIGCWPGRRGKDWVG